MFQSKFFAFGVALAIASCSAVAADKKGDPDKGKEVFQQCAVCHNADSTDKKMGRGMNGLFSKEKMNYGKKPT